VAPFGRVAKGHQQGGGLESAQLFLLAGNRLMLRASVSVFLDPVMQALGGNTQPVSDLADLVAPIGDLFDGLDLEFFGITFSAHGMAPSVSG
jgi:hypothetical protein